MFCSKCAAQIPDDSITCPNCGAPVPKLDATVPQTTASNFSQPQDNGFNSQVNMQAPNMQPNMQPTTQQPNMQQPVYIPNSNNYYQPMPQKSSKKGLFIGLGIAAALIIAAIAVLLVFLLSDKKTTDKTPVAKFVSCAKNTAFSGFDFKMEAYVERKGDKEDSGTATGFFTIDVKKHKIQGYVESISYYRGYNGSRPSEDKSVDATYINGDDIGTAFIEYEDGVEDYSYGYMESFDDAYSYYNRYIDFNEDNFFNALKTLANKDLDKIDYVELLDSFGDISSYCNVIIKPEEIDDFIGALIKAYDDNRDQLGFEKHGNTYSFDFNLKDLVEIGKPVLDDYLTGLARKYVNDAYDEVNMRDLEDIKIQVEYDIEGDVITYLLIKVQPEGYTNSTYVIEVTFDNVGSCKSELDDDIIDLMKKGY
jgi:hypothetical protein